MSGGLRRCYFYKVWGGFHKITLVWVDYILISTKFEVFCTIDTSWMDLSHPSEIQQPKYLCQRGFGVGGSPRFRFVKDGITCDWACSPMVGRSSGTLLTRVQILVLAPFPRFSRIYRRYALSGKRRSRRRRGAIGDFGNLQMCRCSVLRRCS
jgi:hypothetical protein